MAGAALFGWDHLRHSGLLLDPARLRTIQTFEPDQPLSHYTEKELRRQIGLVQDGIEKPGDFATFVLQEICRFTDGIGTWQRGSAVSAEWSRTGVTGEAIKPRHLWRGEHGAILPVFIDTEARLGIGRGTRAASQTLQWLRKGRERLAVLSNGRQWRLIFAGLDFDAWCQWDIDLWLEEGELGPQVQALRTLLQPALWTPPRKEETAPLVQAILDSRKGQAELSAVLGERVREAVELLVQAHGEPLKGECADVDPTEIYRAAVRIVMRMVVILFAESREHLLPRSNQLYHASYGLTGLREELDKAAARTNSRLKRSTSAWPRMLALFRLIYSGSHHNQLAIPEYQGELFEEGSRTSEDGLARAVAVLENACYEHELLFTDDQVYRMLRLLTSTKVRIRQGRTSTWATVPVDFSDLSSEYIGILYEGLLDFELRTAPSGDPVIFLAVGNQPALPLSRLEEMGDREIADLLEKMKDTSSADADEDEQEAESEEQDAESEAEENPDEFNDAEPAEVVEPELPDDDHHRVVRTRAEEWARRAVRVGKLVAKPRGTLTPVKQAEWDAAIGKKAAQIVSRVVLPGEWYLLRWGGTRKGSGTFYTRPGLAVPTVQRTLRPLAFDPPKDADGGSQLIAPAGEWTPKSPEEILALKVCDPACGSGTFPVAALRFLTDALYASLHHHGRISERGDRALIQLFRDIPEESEDRLGHELLPARPDDPSFEGRLKAVLRRHIVERCIYGVDLDPLAVELCRLSLWIETMDRDLPFSFLRHKIKIGNSLVGAWLDTFQHYPVMAWKNREGGDKGHSNGVHFEKEERTKAIKRFVRERLTPDLQTFIRVSLHENVQLFTERREEAGFVHAHAQNAFAGLHDMPANAAAERARRYQDEVEKNESYQALKRAFDLWCACWFWPVEDLQHAPLPTGFAAASEKTREAAHSLWRKKRFFHWELEFPDVFNASRAGFDAILGNPPWDIAKPNSKEFFSNIDPLYRAYGKQEALTRQREYFTDGTVELRWLDYNGDFRAQSNFVGHVAAPFGDPEAGEERFSISRGAANLEAHARWRRARTGTGYSQPKHPFQHQGSADLNLYKLFLEQAHALLRDKGRLGFIVPSGLYSDHGTGELRRLFLDQCDWQWLFGIENRDGIFDIHRSFKFNPIIVEKGGITDAIQTAFMRRRLEDWEVPDQHATPYSRAQVDRFSPKSKAILEIQSKRDLEILEKIYANSVLLGDDGPDGWGITYAREFDMTNDSKLFPPRPKWEADGYRPDEYSRWIKGNWRPIAELWPVLGVDPTRVVPLDPECERRIGQPDVQRTEWRVRCAQPPYDNLPIPRADIPAGIILSREAGKWLANEDIEDVALPFYQGVMMNQLAFTARRWVSGTGLSARWEEVDPNERIVGPQFLMQAGVAGESDGQPKVVFRDIARSTDERTCIAAAIPPFPCANVLGVLRSPHPASSIAGLLASFCFDWALRQRIGGTHLNWYIADELPLPSDVRGAISRVGRLSMGLTATSVLFAGSWLSVAARFRLTDVPARSLWLVTPHERTRGQAVLEALAASSFGLSAEDVGGVLEGCDLPLPVKPEQLQQKGFWRVDSERHPELRRTVLAQIAMKTLASQESPSGEGWALPDTVRLADFGLGSDLRATRLQPVAAALGPRFLDWQLSQSAAESWLEYEVHEANLRLGGKSESATENTVQETSQPLVKQGSGQAEEGKQRSLLSEELD